MKSKVCFLVIFGLLFVFLMGCGGSSSGINGINGTTVLSIVGTWTKASSTGDGANLPDQFIFNVNGSGSFSGVASGSANFNWTYQGTTLVINLQGGTSDSSRRTSGRYSGKSANFDNYYRGNSHL